MLGNTEAHEKQRLDLSQVQNIDALEMQTFGKDASSRIQSFSTFSCSCVCIALPFLIQLFNKCKSRAGLCLKITLWGEEKKSPFSGATALKNAQ